MIKKTNKKTKSEMNKEEFIKLAYKEIFKKLSPEEQQTIMDFNIKMCLVLSGYENIKDVLEEHNLSIPQDDKQADKVVVKGIKKTRRTKK